MIESDIRVGEPTICGAISVFPLFTAADCSTTYHLFDEASASDTITVEETRPSGTVPTVVVTNRADEAVLFVEGEELAGAKQNRVVSDRLLPEQPTPHEVRRIPTRVQPATRAVRLAKPNVFWPAQ